MAGIAGTGRSLSLKLIQQLREEGAKLGSAKAEAAIPKAEAAGAKAEAADGRGGRRRTTGKESPLDALAAEHAAVDGAPGFTYSLGGAEAGGAEADRILGEVESDEAVIKLTSQFSTCRRIVLFLDGPAGTRMRPSERHSPTTLGPISLETPGQAASTHPDTASAQHLRCVPVDRAVAGARSDRGRSRRSRL